MQIFIAGPAMVCSECVIGAAGKCLSLWRDPGAKFSSLGLYTFALLPLDLYLTSRPFSRTSTTASLAYLEPAGVQTNHGP